MKDYTYAPAEIKEIEAEVIKLMLLLLPRPKPRPGSMLLHEVFYEDWKLRIDTYGSGDFSICSYNHPKKLSGLGVWRVKTRRSIVDYDIDVVATSLLPVLRRWSILLDLAAV